MPRCLITIALAAILISASPAVPQSTSKIQPKAPAVPQSTTKIQPKLEPIAETKLLMEGMAHTNFRGIERILQQKPSEIQNWTFARGQALLIAETANLLMLRPPKTQGQPIWFDRATELRTVAQEVAKTISTQDYEKSRSALLKMATSCNRCHESFRVPVEINAFTIKTTPEYR